MTSQYIQVIEEELESKYPEHKEQDTLKLENIKFKLFLSKTTLMLAEYQNLRTLSINHCDLRNLDNFPRLYTLEQLDLGFNQIQGTFNNLMPLKRLKYLNVEHNLIFESNKLAPLRKIAACNSNQYDKNQTKISVCIRNNPFIEEDTPYLIKFKNYGLKVIKQPKEYFDKIKLDQEKLIKFKLSAKKGKKAQSSQSKSCNKRKINWFQQSSNQDSSVLEQESPIMQPNNDQSNLTSNPNNTNNTNNANNVNNAPNNLNRNDRRSSILDDEPMHILRVSRRSIVDNFGDDTGRLLVRMSSSRGERAQLRDDIIEESFPDFSLMNDEVEEDQIHHLREMFIFQDEDDDSDSDGDEDDRFHNDLNRQSSNSSNNQGHFQQRLRSIERRNAILRERREIERHLRQRRILRQRARRERQEERQRRILNQRQMRLDLERRREERELLRREESREIFRRQEQRHLLRRLSSASNRSQNHFRNLNIDRSGDLNASVSSSGERRIIRITHSEGPNNLGNPLGSDSNQPIPVIDPIRRTISSRQAFRRRLLQRSQSHVTGLNNNTNASDNLNWSNNLNTNNNLGISVLPSLRIRASEDIHPEIALIQRSSSIPGNVGRIFFSGEGEMNERMHIINNGSMDSESDSDGDNNLESISDSSDHDEEDDDDNDDDDDHICESNCNCDPYGVEEENQEEDQQQNREQPQPHNGRNEEDGAEIDSAMELLISGMDNPHGFDVDYESSDEQFDFVLDENGLPVDRRQHGNTHVNSVPQQRNNPQHELLPDYESSDGL